MKSTLNAGFLFWFLLCTTSHAQTACPPGMEPYGAGVCGYSQPMPSAQLPLQQPTNEETPQWESQWLAIATDSESGSLGTAIGMKNREDAERVALADCQAKGGTKCKLDVSYGNGCAAMIVGDGGYNSNGASTVDEAVRLGMKVCIDAGHTNCRVFYSACSLPVRIR